MPNLEKFPTPQGPSLDKFPVSKEDKEKFDAEREERAEERKNASFEEVQEQINIPDKGAVENKNYDPIRRLKHLSRRSVEDFSGSDEEKRQLEELFDKRALELLKANIDVPDKAAAENPKYDPAKRLEFALTQALKFPLFDESLKAELEAAAEERKSRL